MLKIVLLGGSNSVLQEALATGLGESAELTNLALGATTSMQNLAAVVANRALIAQADLVVTESNVNDIAALRYLDLDREMMKGTIDRLYAELYRVNPNCLALLIPLNSVDPAESPEIAHDINARHLVNARRCGFFTIDMTMRWREIPAESITGILPDARHPLHSYMYHLGCNIVRELTDRQAQLAERRALHQPSADCHYEVVGADRIFAPREIVTQSNSLFSARLGTVTRPVPIPAECIGRRLLAIGTWSDDLSALRIRNEGRTILKAFPPRLLALNELRTPFIVTPGATLEPYDGPLSELTEDSINLPRPDGGRKAEGAAAPDQGEAIAAPTRLESLLVEDADHRPSLPSRAAYGAPNLDHILPRVEPYIEGSAFYTAKRRLVPGKIVNIEVMTDAAERLAEIDGFRARQLLKIVLAIDRRHARARALMTAILAREGGQDD